MIEVQHLSKRYGEVAAISNVSFHVGRGEVVGFLGPNGAGKSTTMRILCGCIGATEGSARVGGIDVLDDPERAKRRIGYLPEVPPLYPGMSVEAYVRFAAELRGVSDPAAATRRALDRVGLSGVRPRIIEHLSKGFRQRVGLAQALVHDPDVLVLDEPTSGLDPAQRREIRDLLADLAAGERTVILSTHVLPEVEAICQRVVIINQGQIVAEDRIDALGAEARRVRVELDGDAGPLADALGAWPGVSVERVGHTGLRVGGAADRRAELARAAAPHGLIELRLEQGLEDVYLALTSKGNT